MATSRSDHHRRQAGDYNEVPVISCDYGFCTDGRDDEDERQITEAEAIAGGRDTNARDSGQEKQNDSCRLCTLLP